MFNICFRNLHRRQMPQLVGRRQFSAARSKTDAKQIVGAILFTGLGTVTACLGVWQIQRRQWKIDLIEHRSQKLLGEPEALTEALWQDMPDGFQKVACKGQFDYSRQVLIGPRSSPVEQEAHKSPGDNVGYFLVTPLQMECGEILVNRGWVQKASAEGEWQETKTGEIEVTGVLRHSEKPNSYMTGYEPDMQKRQSIICDLSMLHPLMNIKTVVNSKGEASRLAYIELTDSSSGLVCKTTKSYLNFHTTPELHAVYAGTWLTLSVCLLGLTAMLFRTKTTKKIPGVVTNKSVLKMPKGPNVVDHGAHQ